MKTRTLALLLGGICASFIVWAGIAYKKHTAALAHEANRAAGRAKAEKVLAEMDARSLEERNARNAAQVAIHMKKLENIAALRAKTKALESTADPEAMRKVLNGLDKIQREEEAAIARLRAEPR